MQASLNFLSPEKKAVLRKGFVFAYVQNMLALTCLVVLFCSGMLLALRMMLRDTERDLEAQGAGSSRDTEVVTAEIKAVNDYLAIHEGYRKGFQPWSRKLSEIADAIPEGAQLLSVRIDDAGSVEINGRANERKQVLEIEAKLKQSPTFKDLVSPLTNILTEYQVNFHFTMNMTEPPALPTVESPTAKPRRGRTPTTPAK